MSNRRYFDIDYRKEQSKPLLGGATDPEYGSLPTPSELANKVKAPVSSSLTELIAAGDDFEDNTNPIHGQGSKNIKSGRQRKKIAARSKGGEFQARRRKRRLYFCCISNDIDVEQLADVFQSTNRGFKGKLYDEVLHLYTEKSPDLMIPEMVAPEQDLSDRIEQHRFGGKYNINDQGTDNEAVAGSPEGRGHYFNSGPAGAGHFPFLPEDNRLRSNTITERDDTVLGVSAGGKEVFVFDFGAVVFWGCSREESNDLLGICKEHIPKGLLSQAEFEAGEDDMAFITSYEAEGITIANDVIILPETSSAQSRLAVSFAIAQSAVLSIFEARIEQKIEDYKFIPEELAESGRVNLTPKQLGNMIGEVFVIRHDVNLHSEILDIPDYFWKENAVEPLYRMTAMYLEMEPRTEVLNKRLDLLRELLRLVQHQHENAHNVKLEWIVIWLIIVSVVLELYVILGHYFDLPAM
eukprot:gene33892-41008_t